MENNYLFDKILNFGKEIGFQDMEISYENTSSSSIKVYKQEIDSYNLSESEILKFRGIHNNKLGSSYTEKVDESSIELLVNDALENSQINNSNENAEIFKGSDEYKKVTTYNESLNYVTEDEKINFAKAIEKSAYALDKRVINVQVSVFIIKTKKMLSNTKGLNLESLKNMIFITVNLVAKENKYVKTAFTYTYDNDFSKLDAKSIAKEAVDKATKMLGASTLNSGIYPCIIENETMSKLLKEFVVNFSADKVQKNLSLFKGKLNQKVACDSLTIIDDPFLENGYATSSFDNEGAACTYKVLIENGILKNYLYDLKTAKIDGVKTTGNANVNSTIAPTNMYIKSGVKSLDDIISTIDNGVLINQFEGLHSGLNKVSGDFSLSAAGFLIVNGKIDKPIEQFTVAGNFFDMIKNIDCIADDTKFGMPRISYVGSPSIKFNSLTISCE